MQQAVHPRTEPVPADQIKFVCDTMLQGLGKSLRRCGIDTTILENVDDHKTCVHYCYDEQRNILSRGQAANMVRKY